MKKTESYVRRMIQDNIDDIASVVKKDVAEKLRDKLLLDMVKIDLEKPPELKPQPKETKKQREARLEKEQEWLACYKGVKFDFSYESAMIDDMVELIDEQLKQYLLDPEQYNLNISHARKRKLLLF